MTLEQWAIKHNVTHAAIDELRNMFLSPRTDPKRRIEGESEGAVSNRVTLEASRVGARLWRNNVGAYKTRSGRWVRYGLCNLSEEMNKEVKSSDLIGIKPILITPSHVGSIIGQFVAREVKEEVWIYSGDEHEVAQLNYLQLVFALGGDAAFVTGEGSF